MENNDELKNLRYENPPIKEAYFTAKLNIPDLMKPALPGLMLSNNIEEYAISESPFGKKNGLRFERKSNNAYLFDVIDRDIVIRISPPYLGWTEFKNWISIILNNASIDVTSNGFLGLDLHYHNRILVPASPDGVDFGKYIEYVIASKSSENPNVTSFILGFDTYSEEDGDVIKLEYRSNGSTKIGDQIFHALSYKTCCHIERNSGSPLNINETHKWLDSAHTRIQQSFESGVAQTLREQWGKSLP